LNKLNEDIANLSEKRNALNAQWENEKGVLTQIQQKKATIEAIRKLKQTRPNETEIMVSVAEIRYGLIKKNEEDLF
jgi:ATP-dependent Clp protease ATP-binding subunit ClpB